MRISTIIFVSIFTLITGLISFYIFIRGLQSIPPNSALRNFFIIVFWAVALSFICGRIFENVLPHFLGELLVWIGSFWIAASLYFLLAVVTLDLLRLVNHFIPFFPAAITAHYQQAKQIVGACVFGLVGMILLAGYLNSLFPRVVTLNLSVARKAAKLRQLNIVAVSDIHLGAIVGRSRIDGIVERINALDPDLVLLPGDIVDEDLAPVIKQNLGEALSSIKSRFGVFAVTGNHEYIGGVEEACRYLVAHHITMLRDQSALIADSVFLVGREDRSSNRFPGGHPRKDLSELMRNVDRSYPVVLMDHQPFGLEEAVTQNIDLQISGHTHDGQLWPINYIVNRVYELPWGYKKLGNTHIYVSDGVGTWGPPARIGNRPEIVNIHLGLE
jgi:predicted MPP superfamily phosphohydrolase